MPFQITGVVASSRPERRIARVVVLAALCLGVCAALVTRLDLDSVAGALRLADPRLLGVAALCNLLIFVARGLRLHLLVAGLLNVSVARTVRVSCLATLASSAYPGVGEAARVALLRRCGLTVARSATVTLVERFIDTSALGFIFVAASASAGATSFNRIREATPIIALGFVGILVGFIVVVLARESRSQQGPARVPSDQRPGDRFGGWVYRTVSEVIATGQSLCPGNYRRAVALGLTLLMHGLAIGIAWLTFRAFNVSSPLIAAAEFIGLINVGMALLPAPFGLGLYQLAALVVLQPVGANAVVIVAAATMLQAVNYGATIAAALLAAPFEFRRDGAASSAKKGLSPAATGLVAEATTPVWPS